MNNRLMISTLPAIAAAVVLAANGHAADINVPGDQPTIQAGINAANPGDVVIVAVGEYFENINFLGKAITVRSTDPNDAGVVLNTIINGGGSGTVVTCTNSEGPDTVLGGLVITGGNAVDGGGGMLNAASSPTVTNCSFIGNTGAGGGMFNAENSSPTVTNCTFSGNTATDMGGGMFNDNSSPTVTNCSFSANSARSGGGMGNANGSSPTVTNCSFIANTATATGGGMVNSGGSPTLSNTGFCGNRPDQIAGDLITDGGGNSLLYCPPPIPPTDPCPTDTNGDGVTDVLDLIELLLAFGAACP